MIISLPQKADQPSVSIAAGVDLQGIGKSKTIRRMHLGNPDRVFKGLLQGL